MKKNHNFQLTIQKKGFSQNKSGALMGTFCSFLLFFFACGSCLLNFSLIFHPGFSILSIAELCIIPAVAGTFLFALRGRENSLTFSLAPWEYCSWLCIFSVKIFSGSFSAPQELWKSWSVQLTI